MNSRYFLRSKKKMSMAKNQRKNEKNNDMSDYIISEDAQNAFENGDYFVTSQPKSLLKELLEKEPEKLDSQCEDGCTCEKFGNEINLKEDYDRLYEMTFQSQPTNEEHFRFEQELKHKMNRQKMVKQMMEKRNISMSENQDQGGEKKPKEGEGDDSEEKSRKKQKIIKENVENQSEVVSREEKIGKEKKLESESDPDIEEEEIDALVVDCA